MQQQLDAAKDESKSQQSKADDEVKALQEQLTAAHEAAQQASQSAADSAPLKEQLADAQRQLEEEQKKVNEAQKKLQAADEASKRIEVQDTQIEMSCMLYLTVARVHLLSLPGRPAAAHACEVSKTAVRICAPFLSGITLAVRHYQSVWSLKLNLAKS